MSGKNTYCHIDCKGTMQSQAVLDCQTPSCALVDARCAPIELNKICAGLPARPNCRGEHMLEHNID
eukprot:8882494-Alexandrium_andersonii.AAC.1